MNDIGQASIQAGGFALDPVRGGGQSELRPLWWGIAADGFALLLSLLEHVLRHRPILAEFVDAAASFASLYACIYFLMVIHRIARVLQEQPDWVGLYSPAGLVWRMFIPLYSLYVLYTWLAQVQEFANARNGSHSAFGRVTFIAFVIAFLPAFFVQAGYWGLAIACFYIVYGQLKPALSRPAFGDGAAPLASGILRLG